MCPLNALYKNDTQGSIRLRTCTGSERHIWFDKFSSIFLASCELTFYFDLSAPDTLAEDNTCRTTWCTRFGPPLFSHKKFVVQPKTASPSVRLWPSISRHCVTQRYPFSITQTGLFVMEDRAGGEAGGPPAMHVTTPPHGNGNGIAGTQPRAEIYTYESSNPVFAMNWSVRRDKKFRLAIGSYLEQYENRIEIIHCKSEVSFRQA